ncbi:TPA: conjugal transfer protein TraD [Yersinia enterocolitica]|uniref:conjugal transfer protein TraD n=1 Tax=Yersinia enterocolitica TaxID=630 RepID=UPI0005DB5DAA|nr:conjugal transfer protein TraD [Yersinia enterocolitica]EKN3682211.1 conjugal transfer protein TraD [Yersinia enterocolitica]EKN4830596.1 conjugal transfer protein TraD [Yersinia enterocolitica]EKN4853952.1 conjugal transfer protein TraD [Yersinia enterocolitica]EKN6109351.1 conjugal transfer protein TraD [Yersinia enterocolitica]ELW8176972.1 conjugal transfer protein TraD [Yersinia enterocolitica]
MTTKTIKQQISAAQERLFFLEAKKKQQTKKENTCQKIIFGAEVAKVLGCDIGYVDKELVYGLLLNISNLRESDIEKLRQQGKTYINTYINK